MTPHYQRLRAPSRFEHHARELERLIACNAPREYLDTIVETLELLILVMGPVTLESVALRARVEAFQKRIAAMKPPSFRPEGFRGLRLVP